MKIQKNICMELNVRPGSYWILLIINILESYDSHSILIILLVKQNISLVKRKTTISLNCKRTLPSYQSILAMNNCHFGKSGGPKNCTHIFNLDTHVFNVSEENRYDFNIENIGNIFKNEYLSENP